MNQAKLGDDWDREGDMTTMTQTLICIPLHSRLYLVPSWSNSQRCGLLAWVHLTPTRLASIRRLFHARARKARNEEKSVRLHSGYHFRLRCGCNRLVWFGEFWGVQFLKSLGLLLDNYTVRILPCSGHVQGNSEMFARRGEERIQTVKDPDDCVLPCSSGMWLSIYTVAQQGKKKE